MCVCVCVSFHSIHARRPSHPKTLATQTTTKQPIHVTVAAYVHTHTSHLTLTVKTHTHTPQHNTTQTTGLWRLDLRVGQPPAGAVHAAALHGIALWCAGGGAGAHPGDLDVQPPVRAF